MRSPSWISSPVITHILATAARESSRRRRTRFGRGSCWERLYPEWCLLGRRRSGRTDPESSPPRTRSRPARSWRASEVRSSASSRRSSVTSATSTGTTRSSVSVSCRGGGGFGARSERLRRPGPAHLEEQPRRREPDARGRDQQPHARVVGQRSWCGPPERGGQSRHVGLFGSGRGVGVSIGREAGWIRPRPGRIRRGASGGQRPGRRTRRSR